MKLSSERVDPERIGPCGQEMAEVGAISWTSSAAIPVETSRFEGRTPT